MSSARTVPAGGSSCPLSRDLSSRRRASFWRLSFCETSDSRRVPCCSFVCTEWVHGSMVVGLGNVLSFMRILQDPAQDLRVVRCLHAEDGRQRREPGCT